MTTFQLTREKGERTKRSEKSEGLSAAFEQLKTARSTPHTRAWRSRLRRGRCLLKIEVDEVALILRLIDVGLLDPYEADDRNALAKATEKALKKYCDGSQSREDFRNKIAVELVLRTLRKKARESQLRPNRAKSHR